MEKQPLQTAVDFLRTLSYFDDGGVIKARIDEGEGKLLVLTGDNASGKSFFSRLFRLYCRSKIEVECIHCSMERRTMGGIERAFMYGSEEDESTGVISVKNVRGAFSTCGKRQANHFLVLDEPDIGLSESYQDGMGRFIADFVTKIPELTIGLVVVTHSRPILRHLLQFNPHHIRFGDDRTLRQVVEEPATSRSIEDLLNLPAIGLERFRGISKIVNAKD